MDFQPKTEPGSPPMLDSNGHRNMSETMSISEIVSSMHSSVDRFKEVLLAKNKAEIGPLQEKFELERLMRLQAEEELKRARESYEALVKKVREIGFCDGNTIEELKNKNPELKRKRVDDNDSSNVVAELRNRVAELEVENKKNFETIEKLRTKLARKKNNSDAEPLVNACASVGGNTEREPQAPLQRDIDTGHTLGASGMAPRARGGKGKRVRTSTEEGDHSYDQPNEPHKFQDAIAENAFHSTICKRKPIFELSYQFSDEGQNRLDMVLAEIGRRGWSDYILNAPTKANITWVREFYANFHDRASTQVYLRGKLLPIDAASLAEFIHIYPEPGHAFGEPDEVQTMHNDLGKVDLEAVKNRLCFPGSSWTLGSNMRPRLLKNSTLTLETRAWSRIYLSHIHPVSHISELNVEHAVFLYCIMESRWIDLPTRLQRAIHMAPTISSPPDIFHSLHSLLH